MEVAISILMCPWTVRTDESPWLQLLHIEAMFPKSHISIFNMEFTDISHTFLPTINSCVKAMFPMSDISIFNMEVTNISHTFLPTIVLALPILLALMYISKIMFFSGGGNLALPPGPKPLPIIGCFHLILINNPAFQWIHATMEEMKTEIASIRLGKIHVIPVTCPEIGKEILLRQDNIFCSRPVQMCTEIATSGYLTVTLTPNGDQWRKMKRVLVSEVFSFERHCWLLEKRNEVADRLTHYMYKLCSVGEQGGIINVRNLARHYCANLMREMVFSRRFFGKGAVDGGPGMEEIEYVDSLFQILNHIHAFSISNYLPWLRRFDLDGHEKILRNAVKNVSKYNDNLIDERIHSRYEKKEEDRDILDVLIQMTDPATEDTPLLTPTEIKAQILELMFAAVDNPSNAVEWALAEMINQPMVLNAAVEELDKVVGRNRLVQESDLPKLKYVNACAIEAFRLHPIAAFILPHESIADTNVAGYFIPKGSHVLVSRRGLGRNPKIWKDPLQYQPERHLKLDSTQVVLDDQTLCVLSFGIGRRRCPASLLGTTMTTMLLARLIHGFTWAPPPGISTINLDESKYDSLLSEPLLGLVKPSFPEYMYPMM